MGKLRPRVTCSDWQHTVPSTMLSPSQRACAANSAPHLCWPRHIPSSASAPGIKNRDGCVGWKGVYCHQLLQGFFLFYHREMNLLTATYSGPHALKNHVYKTNPICQIFIYFSTPRKKKLKTGIALLISVQSQGDANPARCKETWCPSLSNLPKGLL